MAKHIIVCGGVISGTGKGVAAASLGLLLKMRGHSVTLIKFDPYLNCNAGILAPREHGECFLCDDGTETDLDLGHYERIAGITMSQKNIYTSGTLYKELVEEQEEGKWLGQTLQINPHVMQKVHDRLNLLEKDVDIVISEIGGTVGDAESDAFYKTARQLKQSMVDDCLIVMVAPILWVPTIKEFKTKPLQRSVQDLQTYGFWPDILLCRVDRPIPKNILDKVSNLTGIPREAVFDAPDVDTIYQVPIELYERQVDDLIVDKFRMKRTGCRISKYRENVDKFNSEFPHVNIAVFGKYDNCDEAYMSLKEALMHAGLENNVKVNIKWVNSESLEQYKDMRGVRKFFEGIHGIIVPGGFDNRGVEGKIKAIRYAREKKIPFLGICLGLQCAVIEFARNVCGLEYANSLEFDENTSDPVIHFIEGQEGMTRKSATMRLGAYSCVLEKSSMVLDLYGKRTISERHRHRYEVNQKYLSQYAEKGFVVSGTNPESGLVEVMELRDHPYFLGTQAHPEFKSSLGTPAPLFSGLIKASINCIAEEVSDVE